MASKVQDPNNVEIKKGFVFNETGNIMMSTTDLTNEVIEQAEIEIKYGGYLNKERESAEKIKRLEKIIIPEDLEYKKLHSISNEAREKLTLIRPKTIGHASRISGISPADINVLIIYLGR